MYNPVQFFFFSLIGLFYFSAVCFCRGLTDLKQTQHCYTEQQSPFQKSACLLLSQTEDKASVLSVCWVLMRSDLHNKCEVQIIGQF